MFVLTHACIILNLLCVCFLRQVYHELVRLDEQELNNKYKIGVIYCKKGQTTEEEMYNNGGYSGYKFSYTVHLHTHICM